MPPIKVTCGTCQHEFEAAEKYQGHHVICPRCNTQVDVPKSEAAEILTPAVVWLLLLFAVIIVLGICGGLITFLDSRFPH